MSETKDQLPAEGGAMFYPDSNPLPEGREPDTSDAEMTARIIQGQIGTKGQHDIISEHMKEYFQRWPSYYGKFTNLEWYHIFLDFSEAIDKKTSPPNPSKEKEEAGIPDLIETTDERTQRKLAEWYLKQLREAQSQLSSMTDNYQRAFAERDAAYEENRKLLLKTAQLRKVENETNAEEIMDLKEQLEKAKKDFDVMVGNDTRQEAAIEKLIGERDAALKEVGEYKSALTEIAGGKILPQWIAQNSLSKYRKEKPKP